MFRIEYLVNGEFRKYSLIFYTEWGVNTIAREMRDNLRTDTIVVDVATNAVLAHYWAD